LNVVTDGTGTRGQLEFDVAGQEILIRQGATVFFRRVFPTP
jgi:hypothetical protein